MKEAEIHVRLYHNGQFRKTSYIGGRSILITRVEIDTFSYTVLMEYVKDYLHYSEIGGIYFKKEKGGWQLVTNDEDLLAIIQGYDHDVLPFYIDNTVDKETQPLSQMQPWVIVRPRKNLVQGSEKKTVKAPLKRQFVTRHQLQQQQKKLKMTNQQDVMVTEKGTGAVRRRLHLHNNTSESENTGENEVEINPENEVENEVAVQNPPLTEYEKDRIENVRENQEVLKSFGIRNIVDSLNETTVQNRKGKEKVPVEDEYDPGKEDEVGSEDTLETVKAVKRKKLPQRPRTRSQAVEKEPTIAVTPTGKEPRKDGRNEKEVTSSYRAPVLKPTCSRLLKQSTDGEAPGSINAYLALRERQKLNIEPPIPDDVPQLNLEDTADEIVKAAPRKPRGRTKMTKVHVRSSDEKVVITLNEENQPVSDDQKIITELTNFIGTLAKDNVSLTYVNWHLVPDKLKKQMWEYTRARYIIPDEAQKWVYGTLNDAWRVHKSRVKAKYYYGRETYEERIENRPDDIPLEDFKVLLKYWGDEEVEKLARENSARRTSFTDTHTMGPKTLAQVRNKLKKSDPQLATPSKSAVFLETRKRKAGNKYKTNTDALEKKMTGIKKLISSGQESEADGMVTADKVHGRNWLVGRRRKSSMKTAAPSNQYVQELTTQIKRDLERDLEAKVNIKVQENMAWMLKKLGEANPDLKLDIGDFGSAMASEQEDNGTPVTQGGASNQAI